ncbi:PaaI family thioesterase [Mycobacterium sp. CVI_P3]|uniref:PaaI family thioesterase n=1 Tax=Mycobacterium pinniadriaticum TaxID=2994102 RepID=A0ABT3SMV8_9MYCO|nr:PaaI family thioesterase [Mycobacterium pinniadriaticum]MCX2934440.1 PaaI family thioesterase [Mycobacterium pinniadriaticum]MCX2940863.1 PaaI family thioesterase [Mycobacterium pinniadriaticum]
MTTPADRERHEKSLNFMFTRVPFTKFVGLRLVDWSEPDRAVVSLPYSETVDNSGQTHHGGAIATLIDVAGAAAAWNGHDYANGTRGATVSMTVNYVASGRGEAIQAAAHCVRRAKELNFVEVSVASESERIVATASLIYRIAP